MINRELIRLKVVQLAYAHYVNGDYKLDVAEQELFFSLSKSYDLYLYMLELLVEVNHIAERAVETATNRYLRLKEGERPSTKFIDNKFIAQLESNHQLRDFIDNQKKTWVEEEDFVRRLYKRIAESDIYKEYMLADTETTYEQDRDLWRDIYRKIIVEDEELDQLLEDKSLYWNDDRFIIDTFVLKTIKQFDHKRGASQPLLEEFREEEDREFARRLFRATMLSWSTYRNIVVQFLQNWEIERMATMDIVILEAALAEVFTFSQIPPSVTINEYVEIAKAYSTPRSGGYINGLLDAIVRWLIDEGKLKKTMPERRQRQPRADTDTHDGADDIDPHGDTDATAAKATDTHAANQADIPASTQTEAGTQAAADDK
ncbi:MAG: transcription antitermination factor NusB [Bacteroidaceae bacterium]|nr:transcription antitermination factor NusB [Bacteroidaceae bacterium]